MKKTALIAILLAPCLLLSACGKTAGKDGKAETKKYVQLSDLDITKCVSSVTYKGLSAQKQNPPLTDDEFDIGLANFLSSKASAKKTADRAVKSGDTLNLSYEATDGENVITDFWQDNAELTVGSGATFKAFEDALVGRPCGEAFTVNLELPKAVSEKYAGKTVAVMVLINYIEEKDLPELTDDFVKTLDGWNCSTVKEFKAAYRDYLSKTKAAYYEKEYENALWEKAVASAELTETGKSYIDSFRSQQADECRASAENAMETLDEFAKGQNYDSGDALLAAVDKSAESQAKTTVLMYYIAKIENISYTDDEYYKAVDDYAKYLGYDNNADMINALGVDSVKKTVGDSLIYSKVQDFVAKSAA